MTLIEQITKWVNQPANAGWWIFTIRKALESGELGATDHEKIYEVAKMEFGLATKSTDYNSLVAPVTATGFGAEDKAYKLVSISQVTDVSALSSNQVINN